SSTTGAAGQGTQQAAGQGAQSMQSDQGDATGGGAAATVSNSAPANASAASAAGAPASPSATPPVLNIEAVGRSNDGGVFARHAIVRIDLDQPAGYSVLRWERGEIPP